MSTLIETSPTESTQPRRKPFYASLWVQVLIAMVITILIFCTVVTGIAGMQNLKKVGRVGGKALLYFEIVSTIALVVGLIVGNVVRPGSGFNVNPASLDARAVADYAGQAKAQSVTEFLMHIVPTTVTDAFAKGDILQVV